MYKIEYRGEKNPEQIKKVSGIPGSSGGFMPLGFPCLSVHVTGEKDVYPDTHWTITWSCYQAKDATPENPYKSTNPGRFKISRVWYQNEVVYVKGLKDKFGNKVVDRVAMNKARNAKRIRRSTEGFEYESIDSALAAFEQQFGNIADDILALFQSHEVYRPYWDQPVMEMAA